MIRVEQLRGSVVESSHTVHVAVVDREGRLVARAGDPDLVTFWRSAAKPFQAMPLVADGVVERFKISTAELALCCASHSSEPDQVALVRELLAKIGCSERDLLCGAHPPLSERVAQDYATRGVRLTAVYSNCSGKHAGMLALARHHGWPTEFYTRLEHPVQQRLLSEVAEWSGVERSRIGTATDGCGVVCYALPLRNMAGAYARLGSGERYHEAGGLGARCKDGRTGARGRCAGGGPHHGAGAALPGGAGGWRAGPVGGGAAAPEPAARRLSPRARRFRGVARGDGSHRPGRRRRRRRGRAGS